MIRRILACALPLLLLACQNQTSPDSPTDKKQEKKTTKPIYIGTVQQVYPDHNFVLVRLARMIPKAGTTLISHPADGSNLRLANLCVSEEKIDNSVSRMIAADIRSGLVARGDAVYIYADVLPKDAPAPQDEELITTDGTDLSPAEKVFLDDPVAAVAKQQKLEKEAEATAPVIPTTAPATPKTTSKPDPTLPSFIQDIPDKIEDWENL